LRAAGEAPAGAACIHAGEELIQPEVGVQRAGLRDVRDVVLAGEVYVERRGAAPGFPAKWGWREEMDATRALLDDAYHVVLEMETAPGLVGMPPAAATEFTTEPLDVRVRVWREPTYCFYARGEVTFGLARSDASGPWVIVEMVDGTGASYADVVANEQTFPCSWSAIKWYYLNRKRGEDARY